MSSWTNTSTPEPGTAGASASNGQLGSHHRQQEELQQEPLVKAAEKVEVPKPTAPPSIVPPGTKRVLVVGKFVVMTADVENCDAVIVQGNLDGNIKAKYIVIMKGARVQVLFLL